MKRLNTDLLLNVLYIIIMMDFKSRTIYIIYYRYYYSPLLMYIDIDVDLQPERKGRECKKGTNIEL